MAAPSTPVNFQLQTGNRQNYLSWDISVGSSNYRVQRSTDGVIYTVLSPPITNQYLDTAVSVGVQYYYKVAAENIDGVSPYTAPQNIVPAPTAEVSLAQLRLMCQQRADRVGSNFVTLPEWNSYINQSMYELYDLLVTADEEYYVATPVQFTTNGSTYQYPLPNGLLTFTNGLTSTGTIVGAPFYKLKGIDLGLNSANNAWVTLNKFNFIDRNRYVYPNSSSTIYGVFNMQYRLIGSSVEFIPTPSANQPMRIWYIPRLTQLLQDTDLTDTSISGWIEYVIVDAAIKALQKEESDVSTLMGQKVALRQRIEETSVNRDTGQPDKISDTRSGSGNMGPGSGYNGPIGGW